MKLFTYYTLIAVIEGESEILFSSFDKSDVIYELEAGRDGWKDEGYKKFSIRPSFKKEAPDPKVYGKKFVASL